MVSRTPVGMDSMDDDDRHPVRKQVRILRGYTVSYLEAQVNEFLQDLRCPPDFIHITFQSEKSSDTQMDYSAMIEYWEP